MYWKTLKWISNFGKAAGWRPVTLPTLTWEHIPRFTFLLIFKYLLITCLQINKQMKTGRKHNSCVTEEWEVFYLRLQTLHFPFQNTRKLSEREQKTAHQVWLASKRHFSCVVGQVECGKLPVVNCTHKRVNE